MFNNEDEQFETNDDEEPTMLFRLLELLHSLFPFIFNLLHGLLFTLRKSSSWPDWSVPKWLLNWHWLEMAVGAFRWYCWGCTELERCDVDVDDVDAVVLAVIVPLPLSIDSLKETIGLKEDGDMREPVDCVSVWCRLVMKGCSSTSIQIGKNIFEIKFLKKKKKF